MISPLGIDHIAIAVTDLDAATKHWQQALGLRVGSREVISDQGVEVQMLYAGDTRIELLLPLGEDTPVGKYLQKRGPGIHHVAVAVADCDASLEQAKQGGCRAIHEQPVPGAHNTRVAFLHPASTGGVLTELVQGGEGVWNSGPTEEPQQ